MNPLTFVTWLEDMLGTLSEYSSGIAIEREGDAYTVVLRLHVTEHQLSLLDMPDEAKKAIHNGAVIALEDESTDLYLPVGTKPVALQPGHQEVTKKEEKQKNTVVIKRMVGAKPMSQQEIRKSLGLNDEE